MDVIKRRLSHALSSDSHASTTTKTRGRRGALSAFHFKKANVSKNLVSAAEAGNATKIRELLEGGPELGDIEHTDKAVRIACQKGHLEVLATLIRYGATLNSLGDENSAPLHVAVRHGSVSIITLLISNGVNVNIQTKFEKRSPLHVAALFDKEEATRVLLGSDSQINPDICDIYGTTPLHLAARKGHVNIMKHFLCLRGVNVDAYDNEGWTALHLAAESGNKDAVQMLIDNHAQVDCQNKYGRTPLHWATIKRNPTIVHLLLVNKASPVLKDLHNKSSLDYADDQRIIQMLLMKAGLQSEQATPTDATIGDYMKIEARGSFIRRLADPIPNTIKITASVKKKKLDPVTLKRDNMETITEETGSRRSSSSKSEEETFMGQSLTDESTSIKGSLIRSLFARKLSNDTSLSSTSVSRRESYRSNLSNSKDEDSQSINLTFGEKFMDPIEKEVCSELLSLPSIRSDPNFTPMSSRNQSPVSQRRMENNSPSDPEARVPEEAIMGHTQFQALLTKIERHQQAVEGIVSIVYGEVSKAASGKRQMSPEDLKNIGKKMHKIQDLVFDFREEVSQQAKLIKTTMKAFVETIKQRLSPHDILPASLYQVFFYSVSSYIESQANGHKLLIQKLSGISEEARSDMLETIAISGLTTAQKCNQSLFFVLDNMPEQEKNTPLRCILQMIIKCNFESSSAHVVISNFIDLAKPNMKHTLEHNNLFILSYRLGSDGKALADQLKISTSDGEDSATQRLDHVRNLEMLSTWRQNCTGMTTHMSVLELVTCLIVIGREDLLVWILSSNRYDVNENHLES